jgi:Polyketide cyclase / dehydrase and lipid transport
MAKVATTVTASIAAPRALFYEWLIPGVFLNELDTVLRDEAGLPGVTRTTGTTGPWDVAGSTRIVHLSDATFCRETVKVATAPDYFAYRLTEFSSRLIRMLVREANGQWWFTDDGSGTRAKWTYTAEARSVLAMPMLVPVIKILWNRYMQTAMKHIKARAEKEVGHAVVEVVR